MTMLGCSNHKAGINEDKMKRNIRILIADDHELVRNGLRHMLELEEDMRVVGDCVSAEEALFQVGSLTPDIVLMDIRMAKMDGIEACRCLKEKHPACSVIMLTGYDAYLPQAIEAGAAGYLLKNVKRGELVHAIRQAYQLRNVKEERNTSGAFEEVQVVVRPSANAGRLLIFMSQLEAILLDNYASIRTTVGFWDEGTIISILLWPSNFPAILGKLRGIAEVEKVEEETLARDAFSKKIGKPVRTAMGPWKRLVVTLKTDTASNNSTSVQTDRDRRSEEPHIHDS